MSRETISVAAGAAAAGLVAGVLLGSSWTRRAEVAALGGAERSPEASRDPGRSPGDRGSASGATADERVLEARIAALEAKFERSLAALEAAKNELVAARAGSTASSPAGAGPAAAPASATAPATVAKPGQRAPGALVPWLPPEGVALVRAWYLHVLAEVSTNTRSPDGQITLRGAYVTPDYFRELQDRVRALNSELDLAKFLDTRGGGNWFEQPEPWRLAEFAKTWDGK